MRCSEASLCGMALLRHTLAELRLSSGEWQRCDAEALQLLGMQLYSHGVAASSSQSIAIPDDGLSRWTKPGSAQGTVPHASSA